MSELNHLVKAVQDNLSKEDRVLLQTVYRPPDPSEYDALFDRVVSRVKTERARLRQSRPS